MFEFPVFSHPSFGAVRVVEHNGEPWFVAKDVASALGYAESSNPARLFQSVPEEWKGVKQIHTLGGEQQVLTISEQGLYFFLGRSDKPGALPFQKWLAGEVIPAIRKHGGYLTPAKIEEALSDPDTIIKLATTLKEERAQRQLVEAQRDEAIRTKAQIGSRREATSMAKASAAVRKAARLEDELGRGETYREVKAIPWLYDVFRPSKGMYSVIGKTLKRLSADLGYEVKKIPSTEYPDGVNAYHVDVLAFFRQELSRKPDMLGRYRAMPREVEA